MANDGAVTALDAIGNRDHSLTSEYRIFGPPGTGKTTSLERQIGRAVRKFGPDRVLVTSLTRTAAAELSGRHLPVGSDRVGTLHSHCFHALGAPKIAEAHVNEWNRCHPELRLTPLRKQVRLDGEEPVEEQDEGGRGDRLLQELNRNRGLMIGEESWPADVRKFGSMWEAYKRSRKVLDFCDLIAIGLRDVSVAPGGPAAIFVDEAQDLNPMQLALVRKWGGRAEYFVIAGDDDQALYAFAGASPEALLHPPLPDDHQIVLGQSYRLPGKVHELAERLIRQVSARLPKTYVARPEKGSVLRLSASYNCPDYAILSSAMKHLAQGKTVMFLVSCAYMLKPLLNVLRKNAIPFHNPYRKSNGFWNPLRLTKSSATRRVLALMSGDHSSPQGRWTHEELGLWVECLRGTRILSEAAREILESANPKQPVTLELLKSIFEPAAHDSFLAALGGDPQALLAWWRKRVSVDFQGSIQFAAEVAAKLGPQALTTTPQIVVGTIHSVKGGEADVVYLFPDLSAAGDSQYRVHGTPRDSVIRVFYVGATRARETLYLGGPETARSVAIR